MKKILLFSVLLLLISLNAISQTYLLNSASNNTTITTCGGTMYDSGGPSGDYSNYEDYTVVLCSDNGGTLTLFFESFLLESPTWDYLTIYDGPSTSGYGTLVDRAGYSTLQGQTIQSNNTCVTLVWHTDGSGQYSGFAMSIACRFPCQEVGIDNFITTPPYYLADDGYRYIDICQGQEITASATGLYPENNLNYAQSDATSTFVWNFGEGELIESSTATYTYQNIRGYELGLMIRDVQNCSSGMISLDLRVRVSTTPVFHNVTLAPSVVCVGETVYLSGFTGNGELPGHEIEPTPTHMVYGLSRADTVFLPDGSGVTYTSPLTFSNFSPNAAITSANDILSICANMEHSYMGDLSMRLICPNGTTIQIFSQGGGGTVLGEPVALSLPVDSNTSNLTPGVGYDYCWSPTSVSGTIHQNTNWNSVSNYVDRIGQTSTSTINQLRPGTYQISGNWSDLIGCPLNGTWTISITDHLGADNGYIFSWGIELREDLYPEGWGYTPLITEADCVWTGDNVQGNIANPTIAGTTQLYTFTVTDDLGCAYDTVISVEVLAIDDPICCMPPTAFAGENDRTCQHSYTFSAQLQPGNTGQWEVAATPPGVVTPTFANPNSPNATVTVYADGAYQFTWTEFTRGTETCKDSHTITVEFIKMPTSTFQHSPLLCFGDVVTVTFTGTAPDGSTYNWDFGGANIISGSGSGPYSLNWANTGNYDISLRVTKSYCTSTETRRTIFSPEEIQSSMIITNDRCFNALEGRAEIVVHGGVEPYAYSWASDNFVLSNIGAGNYSVTVSDRNNCRTSQNFTITEPPELQITYTNSTNLSCYNSADGTISVQAAGGIGEISYIWSDIGLGMGQRTGLSAGEYSVIVRDANGCSVTEQFTLTQPEELIISISPDIAICEGILAVIQTQTSGGTPDYEYFWNKGNGFVNQGDTPALSERPTETTRYFVYVKDDNGCTSNTVSMNVTISPSMVIENIDINDVKCYGSCDGRAEVDLVGGIPPFVYSWGSDNHIYDNLCAGIYNLNVTDAIGCSASTSFVITEPAEIAYSMRTKPASCYNGSDGEAEIIILGGGTPPYSILWPNGNTEQLLVTSAGNYTVTVSDSKGCRKTADFTITQPTEMYVTPLNNITICKGQDARLAPQVTGGTPHYDYIWTSTAGNDTTYYNEYIVSPEERTIYTLVVRDANGCTSTPMSVTVDLNPDLEIVSVLTNTDLICPGDPATIYVDVRGGNGGPYMMRLQTGEIVGSPFTVNPMETTTYYIELSDGCGTPKVMDSITINVRPSPLSNFQTDKLYGCPPLEITFTEGSSHQFDNYLWRFGDGNYSEEQSPMYTYTASGTYYPSLEVRDFHNCKHIKTLEIPLEVYPKPTAMFYANPEVISMMSAEVEFTNYSTDAINYYWSFGDGDSSIYVSPRHYYSGVGEYEVMLVAENNYNCRDTISKKLSVENQFSFYAPTSFTPNGDGRNDCFKICGNGISQNNFSLIVQDRWGNVIYETNHYNPDAPCDSCEDGAWDGTRNGSHQNGDPILANGTYAWFCEFEDWNGNRHQKEGTITIIR
ncbi:PKD domain-containing protein [Bacteroidales bacterium OttesenSCG-928-I21]|nr:PKD domain-containing protein [Bacteroidales bacterium OttesenSCG-928-I21]